MALPFERQAGQPACRFSLDDAGLTRRRWLGRFASTAMLAPALAGGLAACMGTPLRDQPWARYAPMLFDVHRDGQRQAWLFGTLHVGTATMLPWPAAVDEALAGSGPIAIEIDSARHWQALVEGFRPHVELPDGLTLDALLPETLVGEVRRHFGWGEREWRALRRRQPWWVANFRFGTADDREQQARRDWGI